MGRVCTVCSHKDSRAINRALIERVAFRRIASRFGLTDRAVRHHNKHHLPELLAKAQLAQEVAEANSLLSRLEGWAGRIEAAIEKVESDENYSEFWKGVTALRYYLETMGEITKELNRQPQVNVLIAAEVQETIIGALTPYPEAKYAVADALASLEAAA
jgi:hypothetical protein